MNKFLLMLTILLICKSSFASEVPGVTDTEIVLGAHTIESGPYAGFAVPNRAISAYFDQINAKGGVNGRKIKYIRRDSQLDVSRTIQVTKKLVEEDHIFAMVYGIGPAHQAVYKYLLEKKIPDVLIADSQSIYTSPTIATAFMSAYSIGSEAAQMVKYFAPLNKGKKVCFVTVDLPFGHEFIQGGRKELESINKTYSEADKLIVGEIEKVSAVDIQANNQVLKLKKEACDIVLASTVSPLSNGIISYATSQGFKPKWFVNGNNATDSFLGLIPESVRNGIVAATHVALNESYEVPGWKDYSELMKANNIPIAKASASGYASAEFMVDVLKGMGKVLTHENLIKVIESKTGTVCSICLIPKVVSPTEHWMFGVPQLIVSKNNAWIKLK